MSKINYLDIIKKAAEVTWKNKNLWWFGFFASLASAGSSLNYSPGNGKDFAGGKITEEQAMNFVADHIALVVSAGIILFILFVLFLVLGIIGRGALISALSKTLKNEPVDFKSGMREGKKYFWKILGIGFLSAMFIFLAVIILITPIVFLIFNKSYIFAILLAFLALAILIPLAILSVYIRIYGIIYAVLGELKVWASIENAYALLRKNLGVSIIMGLIFILLGMILGLSLIILLVPFVAVLVALGSVLYLALKGIGVAIAIGIGVIIILAVTLFVRSIYETFAQTVWILFFHEIAKPKVEEVVAEEVEEIKVAPSPDPVKTSETL
ncbi:MAG: hypothetical protein WC608_03305 [Parcubacteria group bacterium]